MADEKGPPKNALYRRVEQLERWKGSATDQEPPVRKRPEVRVKFADGCMFLAACFSGDLDEVRSFLERGADINTANIDGLTALHQACIDQNMTMVEFLVDNKADVDVCDNEGWTPLHATASCGFTEIARYLIECGANVAAVNNDGDLPIDICEDDRVQTLLQEEMDKQGIDAEAARRMEEEMMLADANQWLNNRSVKEKPHAQTGATALHVASAKGYVNVMKVLIQANANLNAQDVDGWTPLHAGAHWGQEEACKLLAESLCDMEIKNSAGQTAFDVADPDVLGILEEEKKRQATLREKADVSDIIQTKAPGKRRSSVTRMSGEKKQNVTKSSEQKAVLSSGDVDVHSCSSSDQESDDSETDKKNAINKKAKMDAQVPDLHVQTTGHSQEPAKEIPRIEEVPENTRVTPSPPIEKEAPKPPTPVDNIPTLVLPADTQSRLNARRALLKTGSSSMLPDTTPESVVSYRGRVLRSLSAPRVPHDLDQTQAKESVPIITDPSEKKEDKADRKLDEEKEKEKEREVKPEEPPKSTETITDTTEVVKANGPAKAPETAVVDEEKSKETSPRDRLVERATDKTPSRISPSRTSPDVSDKLSDKKEPSPPVRGRVDSTQSEEAELQRKARAKRSRETRRPTQGVTRDDIVKAEEVLRATREKEEKDTQDRVKTTSSVSAITTTTTSTSGDSLRDEPVRRPRTLEERKEEEFRVGSRRSRIPDLSSSMSNIPTKTSEPSTVSQHTPSTRNSLTTTASNSEPSLTTGSSLNRSTSLRRSRITEPDKVEEKKEEKKEENKDQPKVTAATRARRRREKRNLTGIIDPNNPNNENKEDTEEKKEEKKEEEPSKEDRTDFSYRPERGSSRYSRPSSYTDLSKSTSSLDTDYKRMYDDEKQENEKLKKDLAQTKRDLEQAQRELDRALRKRDSDVKQEKRSLERKVSELEEELKKMKEDNDRVKQENQALIRVISRLSR